MSKKSAIILILAFIPFFSSCSKISNGLMNLLEFASNKVDEFLSVNNSGQSNPTSLESKTDLFHNFPKDLDNTIIQGGVFSLTKSGGYWYSAQGEITRIISGREKVTQGFFTIGINKEGVIYHRCFYKKLPIVH